MDDDLQSRLRRLPAVQVVLRALPPETEDWPRWQIQRAVDVVLARARRAVRDGEEPPALARIVGEVIAEGRRLATPRLKRVINATGVLIHTNLGRSPLPDEILAAVHTVAAGYSTLEYNLLEGKRGSRHDHVADLLEELVGCEAAMVVNNNAAAVLLGLAALARGREVVVSRGELVEIGGAFRIPDVMALSGAVLREVGTTNKTHLRDYREAIGPATGLLLKVHQSNFRQIGFTAAVSTAELVALGRQHQIPVMEDLGSGVVEPLTIGGIEEPSVRAVVAAGVDVVTFSGDKLLGGPQAGIVAGRRDLIEAMKKYPLARAVRVDKMTLAALSATIRWYLDGRADELPLWRMIRLQPEELRVRALAIAEALRLRLPPVGGPGLDVEADTSEIGGGSMPGATLPTYVVRLDPKSEDVTRIERALREGEVPVVARIRQGALVFDPRTVFPADDSRLVSAIAAAVRGATGQTGS